MPDWKIMITDGLEEKGQAILRVAASVVDCSGISAQEFLRTIHDYDALIVRGRTKVTREVFEQARRLRVIGRAGVGVDNIDLPAAQASGVIVVNAPVSTTLAVVELTIGLILALARQIPRADAGMKRGQWLKQDLVGFELNDKVLGVIGMGNIGAVVAQRAAVLGMRVLGYDPQVSPAGVEQYDAQLVTLEELYARSDVITVHAPLTPQTFGLLDAGSFGQMKPGVRLVCTARGGIIDENALLDALQSGKVGGAALDVFMQEPPGQMALVSHPNVIATPHIGAQTEEAQARAAEDIATEVLAALRKQALRWRVA